MARTRKNPPQENVDLDVEVIGRPLSDLPISSSSTVQPNVLLRTGVFVPVGKRTGSATQHLDISAELRSIEFAESEGYSSVSLHGARLNMHTDFKIWCGIVWAFSKYGYDSNGITLRFTEFAKLCRFPSRKIDRSLRQRIKESLIRIRSQTVSFVDGDDVTRATQTGLLMTSSFDSEKDTISFEADPRLWELYVFDRKVLLSLRVMDKIPTNQTAQALYLYIQSLTDHQKPLPYSLLRERLQLTSHSIGEQNRTITKALKLLIDIKYLRGEFISRTRGDSYFRVDCRSSNLNADMLEAPQTSPDTPQLDLL